MEPLRVLGIGDLVECSFVERINRFVGLVTCSGRFVRAHINNTGRLLDLLYRGARVLCAPVKGATTSLRIVGAAPHEGRWALIDTKVQERAFVELVNRGWIPWLEGFRVVKRDVELLGARIDFLLRSSSGEALAELKSAVYYHAGDMSSRYPDTVSLRGRRQIQILAGLKGFQRFLVFAAAHPLSRIFGPSSVDPELPRLLRRASEEGVRIKAIKIYIEGGSVVLEDPDILVTLDPPSL